MTHRKSCGSTLNPSSHIKSMMQMGILPASAVHVLQDLSASLYCRQVFMPHAVTETWKNTGRHKQRLCMWKKISLQGSSRTAHFYRRASSCPSVRPWHKSGWTPPFFLLWGVSGGPHFAVGPGFWRALPPASKKSGLAHLPSSLFEFVPHRKWVWIIDRWCDV